jgi:nicotinamide riboside transporter PnuC
MGFGVDSPALWSLDQIAIAVFGALAVWLSQSTHETARRCACLAGLAAQPLAFYTAWQAQHWGGLLLALVFTLAWVRGLWVHWLAPRRQAGVGTIQMVPGHKG